MAKDYYGPDYPGLEEPLTYTLGTTEESVWEEWEASPGRWDDSLEIIESVRLRGSTKSNVRIVNIRRVGAGQRSRSRLPRKRTR